MAAYGSSLSYVASISKWWLFCQKNSPLNFSLLLRFDNVRVPRENLLNSVADVSADGEYQSDIKDPDQVLFSFNHSLLMLWESGLVF